MSALFQLARRNLARHRRRTVLLTGVGALGVVALLMIAGVSTGFVRWMVENAVLGKIGAIQIHRAGYAKSASATPLTLAFDDTPELRAKLLAVPGVTALSGRIVFSGLVGSPRGQTNFVGRGLEPDAEAKVCPQALVPPQNAIIVGAALLRGLGVRGGDRVQVQSTSPAGRVNALTLTLQGTEDAGAALDSKRVVAVPLATAQELTGLQGKVTEYALGAPLHEIDAVTERVRAALGPGYEVQTWLDVLGVWKDVIAYMNWLIAFAGILLGVVVVTLLGAATSGAVFERVREIGTQLAVGMRRRDVQRLFFYEAAILGGVAAVAGVALGVATVWTLGTIGIPGKYFALTSGELRPEVDWVVALLGAAGTFGACVTAGVFPAWRASRLNPVDALRGKV